jgi:hypothetical protein
MSKWIDQFEAHPFQATWLTLKERLDKSTIDDETVVTSVLELARLRKVVEYLDGLIKSVDPELVPMSTWNSFNQQATASMNEIHNFNSNRNIAHLVQANAHADNLLTYVRPYMVLPNESLSSMKRASTVYAKELEKQVVNFQQKAAATINEIKETKENSAGFLSEIAATKDAVDEFEDLLFGANGDSGIQTDITKLSNKIKGLHDEVIAFHKELLLGDDESTAIKDALNTAKESIVEDQVEIEGLLSSTNTKVKQLGEFHTIIFGHKDAENEADSGLKGELDIRVKQLSSFEKEQVTKYKALVEEIEGLIPGATSAGLASAYETMKSSFDTPLKSMSKVFYSSLGLLICISFILATKEIGGDHWITFVDFNDWDTVLRGLVYKIPFYAPVLWLAYYATKRRSEYQRLQQEYAHKEALAKSYDSYKKQIEDLDIKDLEMQKGLITKAVDAIAYNASETLDGKHGDKIPTHELLDKLLAELAKRKLPKN